MSSNNATVPTIFGATVNKFVRTVEYPRLATICGRKLLTLASGTPKDKLISAHNLHRQQRNITTLLMKARGPELAYQYMGSANGRNASRMLSFSLMFTEESAKILARATAF